MELRFLLGPTGETKKRMASQVMETISEGTDKGMHKSGLVEEDWHDRKRWHVGCKKWQDWSYKLSTK